MEPTIGNWFKVKDGPHRGREGVLDNITDFAVGTRYRISNRDGVVGRFSAEQLQPIPNPQAAYEPIVTGEVRQQAMDLLTGGRVKA